MAEWSKAHAWNACRRETVSRVRIPVSPPLALEKAFSRTGCGRIFLSFKRGLRGRLSTDVGDQQPKYVLSGRLSPNLMTAPIWCGFCKSLKKCDFVTANLNTSTRVPITLMSLRSNVHCFFFLLGGR